MPKLSSEAFSFLMTSLLFMNKELQSNGLIKRKGDVFETSKILPASILRVVKNVRQVAHKTSA
jgi:hypothetical protein